MEIARSTTATSITWVRAFAVEINVRENIVLMAAVQIAQVPSGNLAEIVVEDARGCAAILPSSCRLPLSFRADVHC